MPIITHTTLSDAVDHIHRDKSVVKLPLSPASFTLDSSGVAGFFGGESAVRAMATVNLLPQRRWRGWYNAPGSYEVARKYSAMAMSEIFDGLFPGGERDPAKILMVDGQVGPEYIRVHSPTTKGSRIGHFGYLLDRKVRKLPITRALKLGGRRTMDARVTLVRLNYLMEDKFEQLKLDLETFQQPMQENSEKSTALSKLRLPNQLISAVPSTFALGTILISVGGCVACALVADWFSFASIALGIVANGIACSVFGSGELILKHSIPAHAQNPGDVVLKSNTDIVMLIGSEGAVSPFTRARFVLRYKGKPLFEEEEEAREEDAIGDDVDNDDAAVGQTCLRCKQPIAVCKGCRRTNISRILWSKIQQKHLVRVSVTLLLSQFLAQLLLIPQGTLFGQLMFLSTLVTSWMYHSYLSSLSLDFQTHTLFDKLLLKDTDITRYQLNTYTEAVVFACLTLASESLNRDSQSYYGSNSDKLQKNIEGLLDGLLQSKAEVWQRWKTWVAKQIVEHRNFDPDNNGEEEAKGKGDQGTTDSREQNLERLQKYQEDAKMAFQAWKLVPGNSWV